mmetsp:Transcript_69247/g.136147  ORF Transcript_69247/g.136147 Transcript_69247/m.136147 type:complete len:329 (+) Transcript_69247:492-1478(+)
MVGLGSANSFISLAFLMPPPTGIFRPGGSFRLRFTPPLPSTFSSLLAATAATVVSPSTQPAAASPPSSSSAASSSSSPKSGTLSPTFRTSNVRSRASSVLMEWKPRSPPPPPLPLPPDPLDDDAAEAVSNEAEASLMALHVFMACSMHGLYEHSFPPGFKHLRALLMASQGSGRSRNTASAAPTTGEKPSSWLSSMRSAPFPSLPSSSWPSSPAAAAVSVDDDADADEDEDEDEDEDDEDDEDGSIGACSSDPGGGLVMPHTSRWTTVTNPAPSPLRVNSTAAAFARTALNSNECKWPCGWMVLSTVVDMAPEPVPDSTTTCPGFKPK